MSGETHLTTPPPVDRQPNEASIVTQAQYAEAYDHGFVRTERWLLSRGLGPDLAEEMAQAAWAKGWMCRGQIREPGAILAWVNTIALNLFRRYYKRKDSLELPAHLSVEPANNPDRIDLNRALASCSPAEQKLLQNFYLDGYTSGEISDETGCSAVAVRVQLCRLRRRIASKLVRLPRALSQGYRKAS